MGAMREHHPAYRHLAELQAKLTAADTLADAIRDKALRDYSSEEPYETASELSSRIMAALSLVEIMIEDLGGN